MFSATLALILVGPVSFTAAQTAQIQKVEKRLVAPCCYTQSIAEHGSEVALEMRNEVTQMVANGKSEQEIVEHYRNIYGDRIMIVPDGLTGRILFSLPVAISVLACLVLFVCFRKMLHSGRQQPASNSPQTRRVLSDALKKEIEREMEDPL